MTMLPFPASHLRLKRAYEPAAPDDGIKSLSIGCGRAG